MNKTMISNPTVASIRTPVHVDASRKRKETGQLPMDDTPSALVDIIYMSHQPDQSFHHLLLYHDLKTKFVQLRPLNTNDMTEEVTMELVKIFSDFTPPTSIVTVKKISRVMENVLKRLNTIYEPFISLQTCNENVYRINCDVMEKLYAWIKTRPDWSIGCYFVQWDLNQGHGQDDSPYNKFFRVGRAFYHKHNDVAADVSDKPGQKLPRNIDLKVEAIAGKSKATQPKNKLNSRVTIKSREVKDTEQNIPSATRTAQIEHNATAEEIELISSGEIDFKNDEIDIKETTISGANISNKPPSVIEDLNKQEEMDEMERELNTESETSMLCCTCSEVVAKEERVLCNECKKNLHLHCSVRLKVANNIFHVCFLCLKP